MSSPAPAATASAAGGGAAAYLPFASQVAGCHGVHVNESAASPAGTSQVAHDVAASADYIPVFGMSVVRVSPNRALATGGAARDGRVMPFSIVRAYDCSPPRDFAWRRPHQIRGAGGAKPCIPVPREAHTLTLDPTGKMLLLIGGRRRGGGSGDDAGKSPSANHPSGQAAVAAAAAANRPCETLYGLRLHEDGDYVWEEVVMERAAARQACGPRFGHSAALRTVATSSGRRARASGAVYVYGGYNALDAEVPVATVHKLCVLPGSARRPEEYSCKWELARELRVGKAARGSGGRAEVKAEPSLAPPARAFHAAVFVDSQYLVVHGGKTGPAASPLADICDDLFVYDAETCRWSRPLDVDPDNDKHRPSPRAHHSATLGIGEDEGHIVLFGGQLRSGEHSDEIFRLKLTRESGGLFSVIWTRRRVSPGGFDYGLSRCGFVAFPDANLYIVIGGKGRNGPLEGPLQIEPFQVFDETLRETQGGFTVKEEPGTQSLSRTPGTQRLSCPSAPVPQGPSPFGGSTPSQDVTTPQQSALLSDDGLLPRSASASQPLAAYAQDEGGASAAASRELAPAAIPSPGNVGTDCAEVVSSAPVDLVDAPPSAEAALVKIEAVVTDEAMAENVKVTEGGAVGQKLELSAEPLPVILGPHVHESTRCAAPERAAVGAVRKRDDTPSDEMLPPLKRQRVKVPSSVPLKEDDAFATEDGDGCAPARVEDEKVTGIPDGDHTGSEALEVENVVVSLNVTSRASGIIAAEGRHGIVDSSLRQLGPQSDGWFNGGRFGSGAEGLDLVDGEAEQPLKRALAVTAENPPTVLVESLPRSEAKSPYHSVAEHIGMAAHEEIGRGGRGRGRTRGRGRGVGRPRGRPRGSGRSRGATRKALPSELFGELVDDDGTADRDEIKKFCDQFANMRDALRGVKQRCEELEAHVAKEKAAKEEQQAIAEEFAGKHTLLSAKLDKMRVDFDKVAAGRTAVGVGAIAGNLEKVRGETDIERLKSENLKLERSLNELKEEHVEMLAAHEKMFNEGDEQMEAKEQHIRDLLFKLEVKEDECSKFRKHKKDSEKMLDAVDERVRLRDEEALAADREARTYRRKFEEARKREASIIKEREELERRFTQTTRRISDLDTARKDLEVEVSDLTSALAKARQEVEARTPAADPTGPCLRERCRQDASASRVAQMALEAKTKKVFVLQARLEDLGKTVDVQKEKIRQLNGDLKEAVASSATASGESRRLHAKTTHLEARLCKSEDHRRQLAAGIATVSSAALSLATASETLQNLSDSLALRVENWVEDDDGPNPQRGDDVAGAAEAGESQPAMKVVDEDAAEKVDPKRSSREHLVSVESQTKTGVVPAARRPRSIHAAGEVADGDARETGACHESESNSLDASDDDADSPVVPADGDPVAIPPKEDAVVAENGRSEPEPRAADDSGSAHEVLETPVDAQEVGLAAVAAADAALDQVDAAAVNMDDDASDDAPSP